MTAPAVRGLLVPARFDSCHVLFDQAIQAARSERLPLTVAALIAPRRAYAWAVLSCVPIDPASEHRAAVVAATARLGEACARLPSDLQVTWRLMEGISERLALRRLARREHLRIVPVVPTAPAWLRPDRRVEPTAT